MCNNLESCHLLLLKIFIFISNFFNCYFWEFHTWVQYLSSYTSVFPSSNCSHILSQIHPYWVSLVLHVYMHMGVGLSTWVWATYPGVLSLEKTDSPPQKPAAACSSSVRGKTSLPIHSGMSIAIGIVQATILSCNIFVMSKRHYTPPDLLAFMIFPPAPLEGTQQLSDWTSGLLSRKEFIPSTVNQSKNLWLERS